MSTFDEVKLRTPKAAAAQRERKSLQVMHRLLGQPKEVLESILISEFGLSPGSPQLASALAAWDEANASR